jgi:hypothetical protein
MIDGWKLLRPEIHQGQRATHGIANGRVVINNGESTVVHSSGVSAPQ